MTEPSSEETAQRQQAARRVMLEYLQHLEDGASVSHAVLFERHPDLRQPLAEEFRRLGLIEGASRAAIEQQMAALAAVVAKSEEELLRDEGGAAAAREAEHDIRATMIEVDDADEEEGDLRRTMFCDWADLRSGLPGVPRFPPPGAPVGRAATIAKTAVYRPKIRPPMAVLLILDDNQGTGEQVRIRDARCLIGRCEGDVQIPHEMLMSRRHAEIRLQREETGFTWQLRDLNSTNGTFVMADAVRLKPKDELLVGSRRFRVETAGVGAAARGALVEMVERGSGHRIELTDEPLLLGRDRTRCPAFLSDDPLLEPEHAQVQREPVTGRWCVRRLPSLNGIWVRVTAVQLRHGCWFQLGEQRFRLLLP